MRYFLAKIEAQYGKADRVWVMDRGMVSEKNLAFFVREGENIWSARRRRCIDIHYAGPTR